jgi:hypothetical protein
MRDTVNHLWRVFVARWRSLLIWGIATALIYQLFLLAALVVRFGNLPNYWVFYDWPANVLRIVRSTPAVSDMGPIIANEWLIEIGFMNYDYGLGISEWALSVVPAKLVVLCIMGMLTGLCFNLSRNGTCRSSVARSSEGATALGAGLVLLTNATMSWVVCCATPSWVVGLAMLGVGVSTSLALEGMGLWLSGAGFALLLAMPLALAWIQTHSRQTATRLSPLKSPEQASA